MIINFRCSQQVLSPFLLMCKEAFGCNECEKIEDAFVQTDLVFWNVLMVLLITLQR